MGRKISYIVAFSLILSSLAAQNFNSKLKFSKKFIFTDKIESKNCSIEKIGNDFYIASSIKNTSQEMDLAIFCIDTIGVLKFAKRLEINTQNIESIVLKEIKGNEFLMSLSITNSVHLISLLIKMDVEGNILWSNKFNIQNKNLTISDILVDLEDIFLIGSSSTNSVEQGIIINLDKDGKLNNTGSIAMNNSKFTAFPDNHAGYILGEYLGNPALFHKATDSTYIISQYNGLGYESEVISAHLDSKGNVIIAGISDELGTQSFDGFMIVLDKDNPNSYNTYSFLVQNEFRIADLDVDQNNDFIISGSSEYYGNGLDNGFLLKFESSGVIPEAVVLPNAYSSSIIGHHIQENGSLFYSAINGDGDLIFGRTGLDTLISCDFNSMFVQTDTPSTNFEQYYLQYTLENIIESPFQININDLQTEESLTCKEGDCETPVIILAKSNICFGVENEFELGNDFSEIKWYVDGVFKSSDKTLVYSPDLVDSIISVKVKDSNGCIGFDKLKLRQNHFDINIMGPKKICDLNSIYNYQINIVPQTEYDLLLSDVEIISQSGNKIDLNWKNGNSFFDIEIHDSIGCKIDGVRFNILKDSGSNMTPIIRNYTYNIQSGLNEIYFDIPFYKDDEINILEYKSGNKWISATELLSNENIWIEPKFHLENESRKYRLRSENECDVWRFSDSVSRVDLMLENEKLKWSDLSGIGNNIDYQLFKNENLIMDIEANSEFHLNSFDDYNSCYYIKAGNESQNFWSFSNIACPEKNVSFNFPNVITLNHDGINDYWILENIDLFPNHQLDIYNRWGTKVFSSSDYKNNWPEQKISGNIYFFDFKYPFKGDVIHNKGWIHVLR